MSRRDSAVFNKRWRLIPESNIQVRTWGDEVAVFHGGTGDTHLLNHSAYALLLCLQGRQSLSISEFMSQLEERNISDGGLSADYYLHLLEELYKLHIVEPLQ